MTTAVNRMISARMNRTVIHEGESKANIAAQVAMSKMMDVKQHLKSVFIVSSMITVFGRGTKDADCCLMWCRR